MALVKCRECGNDVFDRADGCPHCGCPHPNPARYWMETQGQFYGIAALVVGVIVILSLGSC